MNPRLKITINFMEETRRDFVWLYNRGVISFNTSAAERSFRGAVNGMKNSKNTIPRNLNKLVDLYNKRLLKFSKHDHIDGEDTFLRAVNKMKELYTQYKIVKPDRQDGKQSKKVDFIDIIY